MLSFIRQIVRTVGTSAIQSSTLLILGVFRNLNWTVTWMGELVICNMTELQFINPNYSGTVGSCIPVLRPVLWPRAMAGDISNASMTLETVILPLKRSDMYSRPVTSDYYKRRLQKFIQYSSVILYSYITMKWKHACRGSTWQWSRWHLLTRRMELTVDLYMSHTSTYWWHLPAPDKSLWGFSFISVSCPQ